MRLLGFVLSAILLSCICQADTFNGDLSTQYYENLSNHPNPGIQIIPDLIYHLDKQNSIMGEVPYRSTEGWQDSTLNFMHDFSKHVSTYFDLFLPTSLESQADAMKGGGSANLILSADIGPLNVKFDNGLMGWDYEYTTKLSGEYAPAFALSDKLALSTAIAKDLKVIATFHLYTFQDFNGQTKNIYRDSVGLRYQPFKLISFDAFFSYKNGELADITSLEGGHYQAHAGVAFHF